MEEDWRKINRFICVIIMGRYHSAQIKWATIQMEFSLSSRTRKTKIMIPFKAPGNFLQIESNRRSVALFVRSYITEVDKR